jgi:hypothetical protein
MLLVRGFEDMVVDCESAMIEMQRATTLCERERYLRWIKSPEVARM